MVMILTLAAGMRWIDTGLEPLSVDEAVHSLKAIAVARHGKIELLGPLMPYFKFRGWHGPVSIYLYALSFLLTPDPRLAIILTSATHVIATSLIFAIGGRYFGRRAGVISSFLFAVHPEAIYMARGIWNPMFMAPFALLYVWTGLLGYCSGHKWARFAHLPMLTLGGQCHPGIFLLAPISLVLWVQSWIRNPAQRRATIVETLASVTMAIVLTMPWIIGVYLDNVNNMPMAGIKDTALVSANAAASDQSASRMFSHMYLQLGNWEPGWTQAIQPVITIVGLISLLAAALRHRASVAGGVVALGYILPPLMILLLSARYEDHFIWAGYGFAFLIQGAVINKLLPSGQFLGANIFKQGIKWTGILVFALLALTQLLFNFRYDRGLGRVSLDEHIAATNLAATLARNTGRNLLMLASDEVLAWEVLSEGRNARVVWPHRAIPLPENGAVMLAGADYDGYTSLLSGGEVIQSGFRLSELPPSDHFMPDIIPMEPITFSNGTTVFGFLNEIQDTLPQAGHIWRIAMIWRVDRTGTEDYKVFTHLLDETGDKHAQADVPGLPVGQQRVGEYVMNQLELEIGDHLPADGPLYLRFGMYSEDHSAEIIDASGESMSTSGIIQIRSFTETLAKWNSIKLTDFVIKDQIQQGPPLEISATWHFTNTPKDDLKLRWRLLTEDMVPAFEVRTDVVYDLLTMDIPSGVFTTVQYQLRIPTDIMPQQYILEVGMENSSGHQVGETYNRVVWITPRSHTYNTPPMEHVVGASFGGEISLLGYDLEQHADHLQMNFIWEPQVTINTSYKYFVHLWRDGQIVAQIDAIPRNNRYPTSWWVVNEIVTESVLLTIPGPGDYTLTTGFYNPIDGTRLPVILTTGQPSSEDWVVLSQIVVTE